MKIVDASIRRPVSVFIFAVAAVVFGWVAFDNLPVNLLPDITYPSLTVHTEYEGTAPAEIESLLTRPVENGVGVVNNVVRVSSSSRADVSEVTLEFAWGTNMDFAALDVRERLDAVRLPADAELPVLLRYDPTLDPIMRVGVFGSDDLGRLRFLAEEELERALERIEGVAAVVVSGGLEEEIQVELDEHKLASLGLSADEVALRLQAENVNLTGGTLRDGRSEYLVRTLNELLREEDLEKVVIRRNGASIIRLADIATVFTGHKDREIITRIDGRESVELAIYKEGGSNSVTVSDAVTERITELREELRRTDPNLGLEIITDQAHYIRSSVNEVLKTALYGGLLAVLVLLFFLRSVQKTIIISLAIPVSVVATFFVMYLFDISLNIMSLGGLTLGVGLLVDNAIVVLEAIQRKTDAGLGTVEAAGLGASEVGRAITASTLTTVCVFVPIVFVEGVTAQLFRDQALTVASALVVSLVVALTLIPMLVSRRFRPEGNAVDGGADNAGSTVIGRVLLGVLTSVLRPLRLFLGFVARIIGLLAQPFLNAFDRALAAFTAVYERSLDGVLRHPWVTLMVTTVLFCGSLGIYRQLGTELIPELIQGEFYANVELPPGARLEVTDRRLSELGRIARENPDVETAYTIAGATNDQGGVAGETREHIGQLTVTLKPPVSFEREEAVIEQVRHAIARDNQTLGGSRDERSESSRELVTARFGRPTYFSFKTAIEVEIHGFNLVLLTRLADQAVGRMRSIDGLADVKASTEGGHPELQIVFDRDRLAAYGLTLSQLASVIRTKVQGDIATDITRSDRTIDIRLRTDESARSSAEDLANLTVAHVGGVAISLSAVADVLEVEGPAEIRRADGSRVALITANLAGRDLGSASAAISEILESMSWPPGYDWRMAGQEEEMQTSFGSMKLAIGLAIFMVYLVMASQFEDLLHPFVILFAVPFAAIGALATMWVAGITVNVVSMIGFVLLAGIVVNDAIVKIDYTNQLRKRGVAKLEAIKTAGLVRLRPILMTSATTVLGLLPMALGLGEGAELRTPMAVTVIGGMITSTLLTLLVVPAIYMVVDRRK